MTNKTILISAYAVNPFKGSEDGTGWNICREIAKDHEVIVVTRKNNIPHISQYLYENRDAIHSNMRFIGYDLPNWAMRLKKKLGERGYVLYYYFWQFFLPAFIKKQKLQFDIAHAVNFHSDSVPTFLWRLGKPTFWGPVGHHPVVQKEYMKFYGWKNRFKDVTYNALKWSMRNLDPFFHLAKRKVERVFVINSSVPEAMGINREKAIILPAVASEVAEVKERKESEEFIVLSVGRFHFMKGFDIAIRAFAAFVETLADTEKTKAKLVLVGKGEEKERLVKLSHNLAIHHRVQFVDWVERSEMRELYQSASAFLFPSHEGAGMVVPEAMSYGLPVITFKNVGPGELVGKGGVRVPQDGLEASVKRFANVLTALHNMPGLRKSLGNRSRAWFESHFTWKRKGEVIKWAYEAAEKDKAVAVFHPSAELYGADRILVNALKAMPDEVKKVVYLRFEGPLHDLIRMNTTNSVVKLVPTMPVIYRAIFKPKGLVKFAQDCIAFAKFLRQEHKKYRFESAYVNTLSMTAVLPIIRWFKIRSFVHVHEIIENPRLIGWATAKAALWFSDKVVSVSKAVEDNLLNYVPKLKSKSLVLHNGIDPVKVRSKALNGTLQFYLFGRIMPKKGQWYLLEALSKVDREKLKNAKFTLMGGAVPGKEHELNALELEIQRLGLEDNVRIKPFASNISMAMQDADVCLVPSMMKDPFPTTVLEAMSAGKPVIATNHGGAKEALNGSGGGLLVQPGNAKQLAEQIQHLIDNKAGIPAMGQAAQQRFESAFTRGHFDKKWSSFLSGNQFI